TPSGTAHAVDGISFDVNAGETVGFVGESGCGKSVTALSLLRLVPNPPGRIAGGEISFDGDDVMAMNDASLRAMRGRRMAMIFQDPMSSLNPVLTIGRQITESLRLHLKMDKATARGRAVELLELVGLPRAAKRLGDYPYQFSGGMRQRVMIAMALSCNPKLILADEITTALDVTIQAQLLELLSGIARESTTAFILITHDIGVVATMSQRVNVMYAGVIVEKATTAELLSNPKMPYTWGLLSSSPRMDQSRSEPLTPIEGMPPDLVAPPTGCRFEPRCAYRREICRQRNPELIPVPKTAPAHEARCWGTQDVRDGGWLIDVDWRTDRGDTATREQIRRDFAAPVADSEPLLTGTGDKAGAAA
ncbi:MAG TPA: ABC transporter ATP-binding protein, partial [Micromonosporaceae bacterium]